MMLVRLVKKYYWELFCYNIVSFYGFSFFYFNFNLSLGFDLVRRENRKKEKILEKCVKSIN